MEAALRTEGLVKRFGGNAVVDGVSLTVPAGAIYGFLGANGAGKTTTIKLVLGLLRADAGRVVTAPGARIGSLVEQPSLYDHLTGRENLNLARRLLGLAARDVDRALATVELGAAAARRVGTYSLGMRQRLGIARALLGDPPLVILDEPTNGLDPDGIRDMRALLRRLADTGVTLVVSSHLLAEVEQVATHVGMIDHGRLVAEAPLATLLGTGETIEVEAGDPRAAADCLRAAGLAVDLSDGERLLVAAAEGATDGTERIARLLVEDGHALRHLARRRPSLEAAYHARIAAAAV